MLTNFARRLRFVLHSAERSRLLREEMEVHLEMKTQELVEGGMNESDARDEARRQFGNVVQKQEEARGIWIAQWMSDAAQDAVFAWRTLRGKPGFAVVATLSAAMGIGACSLIFGIANSALLQTLPVDDASRLVSISGRNVRKGKVGGSLSYPDFEDLQKAGTLDGLTAFYSFLPATMAGGGEPQRYWGSLTTANYFDVVRPPFAAGRGFDAARDDRPGEPPVVVLSHSLWQSRFAADAGIVGRTVDLNGARVTVVGITGAGFRGTEAMFYSEFWIPFSMLRSHTAFDRNGDRLHDRGGQWLMTAGRLREGVSEAAAASEIESLGNALRNAYPATNRDRAFHVERAGQVNPGLRKMILLFFVLALGVAILVLSTACANVANLLLARASARQQEIATRLAIGAGRGRLVRQLLTESVMLALLGGIGGYVIARVGMRAIGSLQLPSTMPVDLALSLDYRVVLFCIALSALTGIAFGLVPALRATRPGLLGALKDERVQLGQSRLFGLRNVLVVAQVSICMVLLICSGLFLRSFQSASEMDTGFTGRNLLMLAFDPGLNGYSQDETRRIVDAILDRTGAMPGVESVTLSTSIPLTMDGTQNAFVPEGGDGAEAGSPIPADVYSVAPRFFETFGIRMTGGEDFRPGVPGEDIVIVNQALADRAFARQNAIGRRILYQGRRVRITGLVATTKSRSIGEDARPILYFPIARELRGSDSLTGMTLVLSTRGNPGGYTQAVRQTIRSVDPGLALFDVRTGDTQLSRALFAPRTAAFLFGLAGLMGVLISMVGIYGVISFSVAGRTKEIGVRMALGATRGQVLGDVLRHGMLLTSAGAAIGLGLSVVLGRVTASLLYGISPTDLATFVAVPALLFAVALTACLIPARRAASLDPIRALRYQ